MSTSRFEFDRIVKLLLRPENDAKVRSFFGQAMFRIHRDEYYGSLEFKPEGVDVVFKEAPWVLPSKEVTDPKELYVAAFHLHSEGHEGYARYAGQLPGGIAFGDPESEVLRKMGPPLASGGGEMSKVLKRPVPRWFRFGLGDCVLHIQFNETGRVEMVTLAAPNASSENWGRLENPPISETMQQK
jgi:hypothetical protein